MQSEKTIDQKFKELRCILKNRDKQSIKMDAHGGHSILFIYSPYEEEKYLQRVKSDFPDAFIIDIAELFVKYIQISGIDEFVNVYSEYQSEPQKLFKSDSSTDDFFRLLLNEIKSAGENNKLPVLVRTGALFGTGIENINIMDSSIVQKLPLPLVILYPATEGGDKRLKFLNFKPASDYRSIVIY